MASAGLLPIPTANSYGTGGNGDPGDGRGSYAHKGTPSLETLARHGRLPTPTCNTSTWQRDASDRTYLTLHGLAKGLTLPTPTARDENGKRGLMPKRQGGPTLSSALGNNHLHPAFVEWMMGFAPGWTDIDCTPSVTPWSLKRRLSSVSSSKREAGHD